MFCQQVENTECPHGRTCKKWGCARIHPEGRIVGFDCQHDMKCWGNCELHHSNPRKCSFAQQLRIKEATIARGKMTKCSYKYDSVCPYGAKCRFTHEKEETPKKKKGCKCSLCGEEGHNKRSCWLAKLPAPPAEWL